MNTLSMPLASLVLLLSLWGCRGGDAPLPEDDPEDSDTVTHQRNRVSHPC